jgi:hypothetical protein
MDDLYNRSVLACSAMLDQPTLETDGGQLRALTTRKLSEFMDDWKIVSTNERQFAAVICRTYLDGRMQGLQDKPTWLWVSWPGTYDGAYK